MTRMDARTDVTVSANHIEHPLFLPFAGAHLATVLTLPEANVRGLVLLLQGLGASRSHKNRVWTNTARGLAAHGIASLRMDYPSMGDSTGTLHAGLDDLPLQEVKVAASFAMELAGVDRMGVIGNCMGLRTGFALADQDARCLTVASILLGSAKPLLRGQGLSASGRAVKKAGKRLPRAKRAIRRVVPGAHLQQRLRLLPEVEAVLRSRGGFFIFFGAADVTRRFEQAIARPVNGDGGSTAPAVEVHSVAVTGTSGFRIPVPLQSVLIDSVVDWMDRVFPDDRVVSIPPPALVHKEESR